MAQGSPPSQGGGGSGGGDNAYAPIWIILLLLVTVGCIWYFFKESIVSAIFFIKIFQAKAVLWCLNLWPTLSLQLFSIEKIQILSDAVLYMQTVSPSNVTGHKLMTAMNIIGAWIRFPMCFILLWLTWRLHQSNFLSQFKQAYTMRDLLELEQDHWPKVSPIVPLNLVTAPIDKGKWAMALTPRDLCEKHHLLKKELIQMIEPSGRKGPIQLRVKLDKVGARCLLTAQLGEYWRGVNPLNKQTKFMFALCLARIERDQASAEKLLVQAASTYHHKKNTVNLSGADQIIRKYQSSKKVQQIVNQHAFVSTVMISMLDEARQDGVFPSADFLWLKPYDRRLWYILNCVGRQTPFPEVAGIYSHWFAEKEVRRRCMVPIVDEAVHGLELAISEIKFDPEE